MWAPLACLLLRAVWQSVAESLPTQATAGPAYCPPARPDSLSSQAGLMRTPALLTCCPPQKWQRDGPALGWWVSRAKGCLNALASAGGDESVQFSHVPFAHILFVAHLLETIFPLTSAINYFGCGSDTVRMWFGRGSAVVQMWFGGGSDVFSDLVQTIWRKLRESGFQHAHQNKIRVLCETPCRSSFERQGKAKQCMAGQGLNLPVVMVWREVQKTTLYWVSFSPPVWNVRRLAGCGMSLSVNSPA